MIKREKTKARIEQENKAKEKKQIYDTEQFGKNLKRLRESIGYSQKDLTKEIEEYGITLDVRQYGDYERNTNNSDMSSQRLFVISDILNVSMNDLVGKQFKTKNMDETIFNTTGLTQKAVSYLISKKRRKKNTSERDINNMTNVNEIDTINYLIENSNLFTLFSNKAKLVCVEFAELKEAERSATMELEQMYINLCKTKNAEKLKSNKLKQIYRMINEEENTKEVDIKLLEQLYNSLCKISNNKKSNENIDTIMKLKNRKRKLDNIKQRQKYLVDFASFCIYDSINSAFKKYISFLIKESSK